MQSSAAVRVEKFEKSRKKMRQEMGKSGQDNRKRDKVVRGKDRTYEYESENEPYFTE